MTMNALLTILDRRRDALGLSVPQLAKKAGISTAAFEKWMQGASTPTVANLLKVADALLLEVQLEPRVGPDVSPCIRCGSRAVCMIACADRRAYEERREAARVVVFENLA